MFMRVAFQRMTQDIYSALNSPPKGKGRLAIYSAALATVLRFLLFSDKLPSSLTLHWRRDPPLKCLKQPDWTSRWTAVLSGVDCSHCESFSLASLRSRIAFFSESDSTPCALPFSSSQGPVRKKQWCRGFEQPVTSELASAREAR